MSTPTKDDLFELSELIHDAHRRSFCLGDSACPESRMIAAAVLAAGYRVRRGTPLLSLLLLSIAAVVSVVCGADGLAVGFVVVFAFRALGLFLRGDL